MFLPHSKVSIPLIRLVAMANVSLEGVPLPTRVLALLPTLCVLQLHGGLEVPGPNLEVLVRNCQATMDCKSQEGPSISGISGEDTSETECVSYFNWLLQLVSFSTRCFGRVLQYPIGRGTYGCNSSLGLEYLEHQKDHA